MKDQLILNFFVSFFVFMAHILNEDYFKFRLINIFKGLYLQNMIKVAETARDEVNKLMKLDGFNPSKDFIRVGVKSGGCSGLSYEMKFDKLSGENDKVFENNGIKIAVDKKSFLYLVGTTLEYHGGLNGKGFVFNNPNANRTCGCGESFSL